MKRKKGLALKRKRLSGQAGQRFLARRESTLAGRARERLKRLNRLTVNNQLKIMEAVLDIYYFGGKDKKVFLEMEAKMGKNTQWLVPKVRAELEKKINRCVFRGSGLTLETFKEIQRLGSKELAGYIAEKARQRGVPFASERRRLAESVGKALDKADFAAVEKTKLHLKPVASRRKLIAQANAMDAFGNILTSIQGYLQLINNNLAEIKPEK